jgi:hypothetical protein
MIKSLIKKLFILSVLPIFICAEDTSVPWKITDKAQDGSNVTLSDGSVYEIHPHDRSVVSNWGTIPGREHSVEVVNSRNVNRDYPIDITNKVTGQTVHARLPEADIEAPSIEAPSEDNEGD